MFRLKIVQRRIKLSSMESSGDTDWLPGPQYCCTFERLWKLLSTTWSHRPDWTWTHLNPPETCVRVVRRQVDNDTGEDSPLCSGKSSHIWFVGPIRLWRKSQKVMLTPHWISAALPAAPLRRLTHVYILKRKNFRLVFSVSNPFLTLASINIWIFKAFDSFSPLSRLFDP